MSSKFVSAACQAPDTLNDECEFRRSDRHEQAVDGKGSRITHWLDDKGRLRDSSLPSDDKLALAVRIIAISLPWMLASAISAALWVYFVDDTFGFDSFALGSVTTALGFFAVGYWSATDGKRAAGGAAYVSLGSAIKNWMHAMYSAIDVDKLAQNPMVTISAHDGADEVRVAVPAVALFKYTAVAMSGMLAGQRNAMRSSVNIKKLPIYNFQRASLLSQKNIDPIEALQAMVLGYAVELEAAGLFKDGSRIADTFYVQKIDSLGNLDVGSKIGVSAANLMFSLIMQIVATVVIPLFVRTVSPGYSAVWISPLTLFFYYALFAIADRQANIAVDTDSNYFTSIKVAGEMRDGSRAVYARAAQIAKLAAAKQVEVLNRVQMPAPVDVSAQVAVISAAKRAAAWESNAPSTKRAASRKSNDPALTIPPGLIESSVTQRSVPGSSSVNLSGLTF